MTPEKYLKETANTDLTSYNVPAERAADVAEGIHYAMGICTEAGEVMDIFKKNMMYGKPVDELNLKEELGDLLWYISGFCRHYGFAIEELMEMNINKLKARYPEKFTEEKALNRDLDAEKVALTGVKQTVD